jgi:Asp-tRNA(Asn)/Glu-tRNA(Gln) amidotransferase C subunit
MKITFQEIKNIVELSHFGVTIQDTEKIMQYVEELKAENKRLLNANILLANERIRLREDIALIESDLEDALQENVYIVDESIDIAEENAKLKEEIKNK